MVMRLAEARAVQAAARDYPQENGEGPLHYVERLCVLSGLIRREDAMILSGARARVWS